MTNTVETPPKASVPEAVSAINSKTPDQLMKELIDAHNPDKIKDDFRKNLQTSKLPADVQERILNDAVTRYNATFTQELKKLQDAKNQADSDFKNSNSKLEKEATDERDKLKNTGIDWNKNAQEIKSATVENEKSIKEFIEKLNAQYLSSPELQKGDAKTLADTFKNSAEEMAKKKLEWAKKIKKSDTLKADIEAIYTQVALQDGEGSTISIADLSSGSKNVLNQRLLIPEAFKDSVDVAFKSLIRSFDERPEAVLINAVKGYETKTLGSAETRSYRSAKSALEDLLELQSKADPELYAKTLIEFNGIAHPKTTVTDTELPILVRRQVDIESGRLLSGVYTTQSEADKIVVNFMAGSHRTRLGVLGDPQEKENLLKSIKNIEKFYKEKFDNNFSDVAIGDNPNFGKNPERPNHNLQAARLLALLDLAGRAKQYIEDQDSKNRKFDAICTEAKVNEGDEKDYLPNMNWGVNGKNKEIDYVPTAARTLFSGKNVAEIAMSTMAGVTLFVNLINFDRSKGVFTQAGAENFMKNLTNPYVLAPAAFLYGKRMVDRTPEAINLFKPGTSEGETRRILTFDGISRIRNNLENGKEKINPQLLSKFIQDPNEWKMIESAKTQEKIQDLLEQATAEDEMAEEGARKKKQIGIDQAMLKSTLKTPESYLADANKDMAYVRYLFYKQFLTNSDMGINKLHEDALKWLSKK